MTGDLPGAITVSAWACREVGGAVHARRSARDAMTERRGLVVALADGEGRTGVGEASPLPGHSPDTLADCHADLAATMQAWCEKDAGAVSLARAREHIALARSPALRFALATAVLDLAGQRAGAPLWQGIERDFAPARALAGTGEPGTARRVPVNALLTDLAGPSEAVAAVARARDRGVACIKVKVGGDPAVELACLRAIRAAHGPSLAIRLDANRAWSADEAHARLAAFAVIAPDYVEEPTADLAGLLGRGAPPVPLALDESLAQPDGLALDLDPIDELLARGTVRALVLKPMLLGWFECLDWAARAHGHGQLAVPSHLFGGPIELAACAHLAIALGGTHAAGLDPHAGLAAYQDMFEPGTLAWLDAARESGAIMAPPGPGLGLACAALDAELRSRPGAGATAAAAD